MTETPGHSTGKQRWLVYASYATTCGMVVCFAAIIIRFLLWLFPDWNVHGMVIICTLVVLETFISFWFAKHLPTAQRQIAFYRGTELVILLVALKIFTDLRNGPESFWKSLLLWPVQFPFNILTGQYFLTILPALACWWAGCLFATDLSMLGTEDAAIMDERYKTTPVHTVILQRFLSLGVFVVLLAAIPAQNIFQTSLPVTSRAIPAVFTYFVLGIILLSLTRYIDLETKWREARLVIPVQIPRRWFAYSALILSVLVLLISWLPTNYGMGLIDTLKAVYRILYQLSELLYELFLLVISLIASLLSRNKAESLPSIIPQATPQSPGLTPSHVSTFNWELVKAILLWGGLIIMVIVALRQYIAYNRDLADELQGFRPFRWLLAVWNRFKASIKKANKSVEAFIQSNLKRLRSRGPESATLGEWNFINVNRLSSRQKVIFYYLALVRRAREAGLPRQEGQTPYEYASSLTSRLKEEKENLEILTESFIEARYSRHEIPAKAANRAESIWQIIRHVLQKVHSSSQEDKSKDN
jgi:hypothetical protein